MNTFDLNTAVFIQNDQIKTDSLKVAEYFGKRHTHVLRAIENLDCSPEFASAHFWAHAETIQAGAVQRESKHYEMTKNGFIFLVMGFTGSKAAQIKEAYINAFDHMAAILQNQQLQGDQLKIGAKVQLNSGSPLFTITKFNHNQQGIITDAQVMWTSGNKIYKETLPLPCLTIDPITQYHNQMLEQFWTAIHEHGLDQLNHSKHPQTIALSLVQIYKHVPDLPPRNNIVDALRASQYPYPKYLGHNIQIRSRFDQTNTKCWQFQTAEIKNYLAEKEIDL